MAGNAKADQKPVTANLPLAATVSWPDQQFHVSHLREEDYKGEGPQPHVLRRDLGMVQATGGMVQAVCFRRPRPYSPEACSPRHYHDVKLQLVYVLKGWVKLELEGQGEQVMQEGSCWIQPAGIKHTILGYSEGHEVLEINIPGQHETIYDKPAEKH